MGVRVETLVSDEYKDGHFHDASEHGLAWATLNELLHVIVFIYTLYGMIQFRVKFIHMTHLVKWASKLIIAHSFYLSFKFGLIALLTFIYNAQLEQHGIQITSFNCSLANLKRVLEKAPGDGCKPVEGCENSDYENFSAPQASLMGAGELVAQGQYLQLLNALLDLYGGPFMLLGNLATLMYGFYAIAIFIMLAIFPLELMYFIDVGFNYIRFVLSDPGCMRDLYERRTKHLARLSSWSRNQASSLLTRGAKMILNQRNLRSNYDQISPQSKSLKFNWSSHGDNRDRKYESDLARFRKPAKTKESHVGRKFKSTQLTLLGVMGMRARPSIRNVDQRARRRQLNQAPLAQAKHYGHSNLMIGSYHSQQLLEHATSLSASRQFFEYFNETHRQAAIDQATAAAREADANSGSSPLQSPNNAIKQLRPRLAINHHDRPSYAVCIANKNMEKFKPFVRSDVWFKVSMILYPCFIFFYFIIITFNIGFIEYYFESTLHDIESKCFESSSLVNNEITTTTTINQNNRDWTGFDRLMYYENIYTVFLLSCASSFYCSYYFGTIIELTIWMHEIRQQIELCVHIILLDDILSHPSEFNGLQLLRLMRHQHHRERMLLAGNLQGSSSAESAVIVIDEIEKHFNDFGGFNLFYSEPLDQMRQSLAHCKNFFLAVVRLKLRRAYNIIMQQTMSARAKNRLSRKGYLGAKLRELMALRLLSKRETVMRATYVNMCLFFDELNETRFMNTTILRRTTQIASGFAFMASITRSQFQANHLTYLLLITLIVFNFYLACAAYINSNVNKMLIQIHSLISASLKSGCENADLFEFWLRHASSFGEDEDANAYLIYGYKVTWSNILNIDSVIFTVYFLTA